ncbi:DUF7507 domain-containing protein [Microbacterium phyllosphaerae]|uniref:DUF7933 domain-containing protein n=1 Tax=Microbacterium phyllosphaerae TaxID=124798 RepID=UPI003D6531DC
MDNARSRVVATAARRFTAASAVVAMIIGIITLTGMIAPAEQAAAAPGTPGTPSAPTATLHETFDVGQGATSTRLVDYVGVAGQTHTAAPFWLREDQCNGVLLRYEGTVFPAVSPEGGFCVDGNITNVRNNVRRMADVLGQVGAGVVGSTSTASPANGSTAATRANTAVAAYTASAAGAASQIQFQTSPLALTPAGTRFYTASVDVAEVSCTYQGGVNNSRLRFSLKVGATEQPLTSGGPIRACTDPRARYYTSPILTGGWGGGGDYVAAGRFTSSGSLLLTPSQVNGSQIIMRNDTGATEGNDAAFDNIRLLDATPQLDKAFSPSRLGVGGTSTLTLSVTNTDDLAAKIGWSFADALPAGLVIKNPANVGGTCGATVTAPAGSGTVTVTGGRLETGQASCTITVDVTSSSAGVYANCAANIANPVGINPPACASVSFVDLTPCVAVPIWVNTAGELKQYSPTNFSELSSAPLVREYGDIAWSSNGSTLYGVDYDHGFAAAPILRTIDPVTGAELASLPITGPLLTQDNVPGGGATNYSLNALAALDTNTLLVGSYASRSIWKLDVRTGATTLWTQFPSQISSAGDFTVLPDGDILAFGARPLSGELVDSRVYRIHPNGSMTQIGTVPTMWGGAQSGGNFFMAAPSGQINRISLTTLPTASSTARLAYTSVLTGGQPFWGASAVQDAGECVGLTIAKTPTPAVITGPGQQVTYEFTVTNISDVRITSIAVTDVQAAPAGALTSGPTCPVTALDPGASTVCTGTYLATDADVAHGRIDDTATAAGISPDGRQVKSNQATATVRVEPVFTWSLAKTASVDGVELDAGAVVTPGDRVTYSVTVTSDATVDIAGVTVTDDLSEVVDDATFASGSAQLVIDGGAASAVADPLGSILTAGPFTLPVGATATLTYAVVVDEDAWSATLTNIVTGTAGTPGSPIAPEPCDDACTTSQITPTPVQIQKVGEASNGDVVPMDGSQWAIFSAAVGGTPVVDAVPAAESAGAPVTGLFRDVTLTAGSYWLEETRALDGFALLAERVPFTVSGDGTITLGAPASTNAQLVDVDGIRTIRIEDLPALDLPEAGGPGTVWIHLIGLVLLLSGTAAGVALLRRRHRAASAVARDHRG